MGNQVYANGREIACKAGMGKSIAAFPDVCLSPPTPPAGPVPIPYPLTAMASDTDEGTKNVKISGDPVMLKDQSNFKKCTGDEAATKSLGMGVVTHNITGKVFFCAWSMDVKIEGENAVRHLDLMTHNHMSQPGQTPPWPFTDRAALASGLTDCEGDVKEAEKACNPWEEKAKCPDASAIKTAAAAMKKAKDTLGETHGDYLKAKEAWKGEYGKLAQEIKEDDCQKKLRCLLSPYKPNRCCPGQTGDHVIDASHFFDVGRGGDNSTAMPGCEDYSTNKAPVICAEGPSNTIATHGYMHTFKGNSALTCMEANGTDKVTFAQARDNGKNAVKEVFPESACAEKCIEAQLNKAHNDKNIKDDTELRGAASGRTSDADVAAARSEISSSVASAGACP